mmetsp:Transcript_60621/g.144146  ORF Transcript_60621/g.144146 Transcript_60621/m.144146 type:complete len:220 (+) Transcript_60621:730-1389(+)
MCWGTTCGGSCGTWNAASKRGWSTTTRGSSTTSTQKKQRPTTRNRTPSSKKSKKTTKIKRKDRNLSTPPRKTTQQAQNLSMTPCSEFPVRPRKTRLRAHNLSNPTRKAHNLSKTRAQRGSSPRAFRQPARRIGVPRRTTPRQRATPRQETTPRLSSKSHRLPGWQTAFSKRHTRTLESTLSPHPRLSRLPAWIGHLSRQVAARSRGLGSAPRRDGRRCP